MVTQETRLMDRLRSPNWWRRIVLPPALLLVISMILFFGIGVAQRQGWLPNASAVSSDESTAAARYVCPMRCTPPLSEPGRCPVCGMELVPLADDADSDPTSIQIAPVARRIAGIKTAAAQPAPPAYPLEAVGRISFNETSMKSISAYIDGRLEKLYADYTGVFVEAGEPLVEIYSPQLFKAQFEYLQISQRAPAGASDGPSAGDRLRESSRQRLLELGMTPPQIAALAAAGRPTRRMEIVAPTRGTVIEKLAAEGDYVSTGQVVYRLADLSTVWLVLELFPEQAASVQVGQSVQAIVQSRPTEQFDGRVTFVDPAVDPHKRTVGVRIEVENRDGKLRIGDYARARIEIPIRADERQSLAMVPQSAVLMSSQVSLVYVEVEQGRFELRPVTLGPTIGNHVVLLDGLRVNEAVAVAGAFLIDSQMDLASKPSVMDPTRALPKEAEREPPTPEMLAAFAEMADDDRQRAEAQLICPVAGERLGTMGVPIKVDVEGVSVFICCEGCRRRLLKAPDKYLASLDVERLPSAPDDPQPGADAPPEEISQTPHEADAHATHADHGNDHPSGHTEGP